MSILDSAFSLQYCIGIQWPLSIWAHRFYPLWSGVQVALSSATLISVQMWITSLVNLCCILPPSNCFFQHPNPQHWYFPHLVHLKSSEHYLVSQHGLHLSNISSFPGLDIPHCHFSIEKQFVPERTWRPSHFPRKRGACYDSKDKIHGARTW